MRIDGDAPLEVSFSNVATAVEKQHGSSGLTGNPVVNAISYICAAPPGIVETSELPAMTGWFGD
jgi:4-hydroxy-tetrahydrodipicolinate reductase